jgi:hypothetical protein
MLLAVALTSEIGLVWQVLYKKLMFRWYLIHALACICTEDAPLLLTLRMPDLLSISNPTA